MDANNLYFSQMAGMDRSTMGTALETDENGTTVRRSTRERIQWVIAPTSSTAHSTMYVLILCLTMLPIVLYLRPAKPQEEDDAKSRSKSCHQSDR